MFAHLLVGVNSDFSVYFCLKLFFLFPLINYQLFYHSCLWENVWRRSGIPANSRSENEIICRSPKGERESVANRNMTEIVEQMAVSSGRDRQ